MRKRNRLLLMSWNIAAATVVLTALLATQARADDCTLKMVADVTLTERGQQLLFPIAVNGAQRMMVLDLQAAYSAITSSDVDALQLRRKKLPEGVEVHLRGSTVTEIATIPTVQVGNAELQGFSPLVISSMGDSGAAGIVGLDLLSIFDVDLDVANGKLRLFSQDHCPGKVVYWNPSSGVAEVPLEFQKSGNLVIDMTLDDKPIHATLITIGPSTMSSEALHRIFGLDVGSPGLQSVGSAGGATYYQYPFKSLNLPGIAVGNPYIVVYASDERCSDRIRFKLVTERDDDTSVRPYQCYGGSDLSVGLSVLRKLHLYLAFKEKMLYATAAETGAPLTTGAADQKP